MAWVTISTTDMRYGVGYFQYEDSSGTTTRNCRLYFQLNSGTSIGATLRDITVNGVNYGTYYLSGSAVVWSGTLNAGYGSWSGYIGWSDIGRRDYSGGGNIPSGAIAPNTPTISLVEVGRDYIKLNYGTASFGNPATGTVYLYGDTTDTPTTLVDSKTTTGQSEATISGLQPNTTYNFRALAYNGALYSAYSTILQVRTKGLLYGSVSGNTKSIKDLYGSVGGNTKKITKLYGSVSGVSKRIF